jgi:hypothetical protein
VDSGGEAVIHRQGLELGAVKVNRFAGRGHGRPGLFAGLLHPARRTQKYA